MERVAHTSQPSTSPTFLMSNSTLYFWAWSLDSKASAAVLSARKGSSSPVGGRRAGGLDAAVVGLLLVVLTLRVGDGLDLEVRELEGGV